MKDPYVYEGTNVLKNKLDIKDEATLEKAESDFVGLAVYWFAFKKKTFKDLGNVLKIHSTRSSKRTYNRTKAGVK